MDNYYIICTQRNGNSEISETMCYSLGECESLIPKYSPHYSDLYIFYHHYITDECVKEFHFPKEKRSLEMIDCTCGYQMKTISYKENTHIGCYKNKITSVYIGWVCKNCGRVIFSNKKYHEGKRDE